VSIAAFCSVAHIQSQVDGLRVGSELIGLAQNPRQVYVFGCRSAASTAQVATSAERRQSLMHAS